MKRLRRILFNLLTAVSTLLFVVTAFLWIQSIGRSGGLWWSVNDPLALTFVYGNGGAGFELNYSYYPTGDGPDYPGPSFRFWTHKADRYVSVSPVLNDKWTDWQKWGFQYMQWSIVDSLTNFHDWAFIAPCWFWMIVTSLLPLLWLAGKWRKRRALLSGRCQECGYDLRATPTKCPECGTVPTSQQPE